jgi:hypothetical protein
MRWKLTVVLLVTSLCAVCALHARAATQTTSRSSLLADAQLPALVEVPVPKVGIPLPDDWADSKSPLSIRLSEDPPAPL